MRASGCQTAFLGTSVMTGVALAIAVVLLVVAMGSYPGGNLSDPTAPGFDFWRNYFCDLIQPVAKNGADNGAAMIQARIAMVLTGVALVPLWLALPRAFPGRAASCARTAGVVAALAMPAVAITPASAPAWWHSAAILLAGVPGGIALAGAGVCCWRRRTQAAATAALTLMLGVAAGATGVLWSLTFVCSWPDAWLLPTSQRCAWLALVVWAIAAARFADAPRTR